MKLLIISNMAHYEREGQIVGWGPAVEEINYLATLFDEIHHIACLHPGQAPGTALPYDSERIRLVPVPPAGGERWQDKVNALRLVPLYVREMLKELSGADAVHVRCPANVSMVAIVLLALLRSPQPRWVKYGGTWQPAGREGWSFRFQRWWLKHGVHRGVVTVNGKWPDQPGHVYSFLNPCLTEQQVKQARSVGVQKELTIPIRLLYVGPLNQTKGVDRVLQILARLQQQGIRATLNLAGGGPRQVEYERLAEALAISQQVTFHGWVPHPELAPFYAQAHIVLLPSDYEGWPKVLSEGMAYGAVPVASAVGSIPQVLADIGSGVALPPHDVPAFVEAVMNYVNHPERWKQESRSAINAAPRFTYEQYVRAVQQLFESAWGFQLRWYS